MYLNNLLPYFRKIFTDFLKVGHSIENVSHYKYVHMYRKIY